MAPVIMNAVSKALVAVCRPARMLAALARAKHRAAVVHLLRHGFRGTAAVVKFLPVIIMIPLLVIASISGMSHAVGAFAIAAIGIKIIYGLLIGGLSFENFLATLRRYRR